MNAKVSVVVAVCVFLDLFLALLHVKGGLLVKGGEVG